MVFCIHFHLLLNQVDKWPEKVIDCFSDVVCGDYDLLGMVYPQSSDELWPVAIFYRYSDLFMTLLHVLSTRIYLLCMYDLTGFHLGGGIVTGVLVPLGICLPLCTPQEPFFLLHAIWPFCVAKNVHKTYYKKKGPYCYQTQRKILREENENRISTILILMKTIAESFRNFFCRYSH